MSMLPYFIGALGLAIAVCGALAMFLSKWKDKPRSLPRWTTCPSCNGTGRNHSALCIRCNASGEIEAAQIENDWQQAAVHRMPQPDPAAELTAALWSNIWRCNAPVSTDALQKAIEARRPRSPEIDLALGEVVRRCAEWNVQKSVSRGGHGGVFPQTMEAIDQLSVLITGSPASTREREFARAVAEQLMVPPTQEQIRAWASKGAPDDDPSRRN